MHYGSIGLICSPFYNMSKAAVLYRGDPGFAGATIQITLSSNTTAWQLPGLSNSAIVDAIHVHDPMSSDTFIKRSLNNTNFDTDWLNDTAVLETMLRTTHSIAAVQMTREQLLQVSTPHITEGVITREEQRLCVHTLSYALQQSLSVLLVIAVVAVICLGP
jgi:hypothetical protein